MKTLTITNDNYVDFWDTHFGYMPKNFHKKQIARLCRIVPEFTHNPVLQVVPMTQKEKRDFAANGFAKFLVYESDYFYADIGKCIIRLCDTWFGFDGNKFGNDVEAIRIDIKSFGIKKATVAKMKKSRGMATVNLDMPGLDDLYNLSPVTDKEPIDFSKLPCDSCKIKLFGKRYFCTATKGRLHTDMRVELQICEQCYIHLFT